ncbi:5-dehydro-4-deoxy-D-glucuronate isomerase [Gilvimarinus xylanilyticus]|uniref:4-deoxy-L-threo-5-hexosulose-uronate ketol-isomerase n=1 Tax=Gilvimarinus xylanilyticus TaxID=2944139 RepID=A0A9X2I3W1_9GAMM|nr:5-dehydro-4-deoxy-D-glucuronate isomerase [Gilvimarinus xylanilyticus]MCP8899885.1 5-dehydro-4-deoxy-D-glucuronate isomerase [Gilvimarinus xylanilyticus]
MKLRYTADINSYKRMTNAELKEAFVVDDLFTPGETVLTYTDVDRAIVGSIVPQQKPLELPQSKELGSDYFCERREIGVINIGGDGVIEVDGERFAMTYKDSLYIARESRDIQFTSNDPKQPAQYYLVSYPAHRTTKTTHVSKPNAKHIELGSAVESNERTINQSIRPGIVDSCQLVMGFTELEEGSVWNTKPPHTHRRRSEIYMYFEYNDDNRVFHFMGEPSETRSLVLAAGTAVISPAWSIHSGAGTSNYTFIWAMGGENQTFDDMDHIPISEIS